MTHDILQPFRQITTHSNARYALLALLLLALSGAGYFGYQWYTRKTQQEAQKIFSNALDEYAMLRLSEDLEQLAQAEEMFHEGYLRSSRSSLAPFFLVYKADAQALQGKFNEASKTLADALEKLPQDSPYYNLYEIKKALVDLDAECGMQCEGTPKALERLEAIAADVSNSYREIAMQHLLEYYTAAGRMEDANALSNQFAQTSQNDASDLLGIL